MQNIKELNQTEEQIQEENERYRIKDDTNANWAFRQLKEINDDLETIKAQKKEYDQQNEEWFNRESNKLNQNKEFFESLIEEYRLTKPNGKINVPAGKTVVRHTKKFDRDDDELLSYLKQNNLTEAIEFKEKVKWAELKKQLNVYGDKAIDENGQVVPGITVSEVENVSYQPTK